MLAYSGVVGDRSMGISQVQMELRTFYSIIVAVLAVLISLMTPAMTATSITQERQRQALDLVFSAPVTLKYYLVGKMISGFRYTWMLLILALPVTSVSVVMGGATWSDVLGAFVQLSCTGLILNALGLTMSAVTKNAVSAITTTYILGAFYVVLATYLVDFPMMGSSLYGAKGGQNAPFLVCLSPFLASESSQTYTALLGVNVPNWILVIPFSLLICRWMLLGAASVMSGYRSAETRLFRINSLIYAFVLVFWGSYSLSHNFVSGSYFVARSSSPMTITTIPVASYLGWLIVVILLVVPFVACFDRLADKKHRPDGWFDFKKIFVGSPAGGLPFVLALVLTFDIATLAGLTVGLGDFSVSEWVVTSVWGMAFAFFWVSLTQFASWFTTELKNARAISLATMLMILGLPVLLLGIVTARPAYDVYRGFNFWQFHMFYPLSNSKAMMEAGLLHAAVMSVVAIFLIRTYNSKLMAPPRKNQIGNIQQT